MKKKNSGVLYQEKSRRLLFPSCFKIYENKIEVYFWPFKYEIPFSDIASVEVIEKIPFWIGWGLRVHPLKRKLYFAIHHGKGIRIKRKNGFWKEIVLSVKNPEKFISVLRTLKK